MKFILWQLTGVWENRDYFICNNRHCSIFFQLVVIKISNYQVIMVTNEEFLKVIVIYLVILLNIFVWLSSRQ